MNNSFYIIHWQFNVILGTIFILIVNFYIVYECVYKPFVNYYVLGVCNTFLRHLEIMMAIHRLLLC